jgi:dipeptidyl aminopeptidase/acylaminoacyl peptidase
MRRGESISTSRPSRRLSQVEKLIWAPPQYATLSRMTPLQWFKAQSSAIGFSCVCGLATLALPTSTVFAQAAATASSRAPSDAPSSVPSIDQALEAQTASGPALSPDGQRVVYEVSRTNWKTNAFERDLWIADRAGKAHLLTSKVKSSSGAQWSPDGRWIAFSSDRPGQVAETKADTKQIYVIDPTGGEARQVTKLEDGVDGYEWAPDSKTIAFTTKDPLSKAQKDRVERYGEYTVVDGDERMMHLWTVDVTAAPVAAPATEAPAAENDQAAKSAAAKTPPFGVPEAHRLTEGDEFSVEGFSWSKDGTKIAFAASKDGELKNGGTTTIYVVSVADKKVTKLVTTPGPNTDPHFSPDGSEVAFETADGAQYFFYANQKIAVVPVTGGKPHVVSGTFDEDVHLFEWTDRGIYFGALKKTASHLYRLNVATAAVEQVTHPDDLMANSASFTKDFSEVAYVAARPNTGSEIYIAATTRATPAIQVTHLTDRMKVYTLARREVVSWKSGDGTTIEGILMKPADFDAKKKYPLLVVIHGGPTGIDRPNVSPDRYYPVEQFVAKGALVLRPNYRGSAGYGAAFRALNVRNLGVGDYADVISGVDYLIAQGYVDKDRVGSMGWSEGGYISAFITTSSDRFKAVSVGAGISDWMTYYVNTDITPFTRQYLKSTPWEDPEIYRKASPISYIAKAKTPTLIQQGDRDKRVPVPDSFELRQALEDKGVPVKMVLYHGFGHPIDKPKQQRAVMEENLHWFEHYIWGEPFVDGVGPGAAPFAIVR